jgi:Mg2+-importing ATPase
MRAAAARPHPNHGAPDRAVVGELLTLGRASADDACSRLNASPQGLSPQEAAERLRTHGPNRIRREERASLAVELWRRLRNPLNALLLTLAAVSWFVSDVRSALVIGIIVALSVGLGFIQEHRSSAAAAKLAAMIRVRAAVRRPGAPGADDDGFVEAPVEELVPGDVVRLGAGDMIPADLRLLSAKDFHVNESALTGESLPADKSAEPAAATDEDPLALPDLCFMGSSVASGFATGLVIRTGRATCSGSWPKSCSDRKRPAASTGASTASSG